MGRECVLMRVVCVVVCAHTENTVTSITLHSAPPVIRPRTPFPVKNASLCVCLQPCNCSVYQSCQFHQAEISGVWSLALADVFVVVGVVATRSAVTLPLSVAVAPVDSLVVFVPDPSL